MDSVKRLCHSLHGMITPLEENQQRFILVLKVIGIACLLHQTIVAPLEFAFRTYIPTGLRYTGVGVGALVAMYSVFELCVFWRKTKEPESNQRSLSSFVTRIIWLCVDFVAIFPYGCFADHTKHPGLYFLLWLRLLSIRHIMNYYWSMDACIEGINCFSIRAIHRIVLYAVFNCCWVHIVVCIFFHAASSASDPKESWFALSVGLERLGNKTITEFPFSLAYLQTFYFASSTAYTTGYGDIYPSTSYEKWAYCLIALISFFVFVISTAMVTGIWDLYQTSRTVLEVARTAREAQIAQVSQAQAIRDFRGDIQLARDNARDDAQAIWSAIQLVRGDAQAIQAAIQLVRGDAQAIQAAIQLFQGDAQAIWGDAQAIQAAIQLVRGDAQTIQAAIQLIRADAQAAMQDVRADIQTVRDDIQTVRDDIQTVWNDILLTREALLRL